MSYVSIQTKSITETEAYIAVFIEPTISDFNWKRIMSEKYQKNKEPNKKYMFRSLLNFSDYVPFTYLIILFALIVWLISDETFMKELASLVNIILFLSLLFEIFLVLQSTQYSKEDYYFECKKYFEKQKQQEESFKPSQAKLVDSNGKEIFISESTYQVLLKVAEMIASVRQYL